MYRASTLSSDQLTKYAEDKLFLSAFLRIKERMSNELGVDIYSKKFWIKSVEELNES